MPPKKNKKSSKQKEKVLVRRELHPEAIRFPMSMVREFTTGLSRNESMPYTFKLGKDLALTSDGAGLITSVLSDDPTSDQNWSSYAGTFDEFRVLCTIVKFSPLWSTGGSTQTFWAPIAHVVDRSDATALTAYSLAERYESHKKTPGQKPFTVTVPMNSTEESSFQSTTGYTAKNWIKFYSSGNTVSLTVGRLDICHIVQFRGLGIN